MGQDTHWSKAVKRVVVKIGSRALVDERNRLDEAQVASLVKQMVHLADTGRQVVCVSSGAIAAGLVDLGLNARPKELPSQQAAAAIGQARLIGLYRQLFAAGGWPIGQVLLTHDDLHSRPRHLNARNTISRLLGRGAIPIVNENDTVAVDEIRFGDNDVLSALVAMLVRAEALIILTSVDGLLRDGDGGSEVISKVPRIDDSVRTLCGGAGSAVGVGGMRTKLEAAEMVTRSGEHCLIANGRTPDVLRRIFAGESLGTLFPPLSRKISGRKRWIAFFDHPQGQVTIDDGAVSALCEQGRSLLAIGVIEVQGDFAPGAPIRIMDRAGCEIGRGLVNYSADDLRSIVGLRSDQIAERLGTLEYEEVVHRDNLVVGERPTDGASSFPKSAPGCGR